MASNPATNSTAPAIPAEAFDFKLYRYEPSLIAAAVSVAVFAILTAFHFWKIYKHRSLYFIPFAIGGVFEAIGYVGRAWSHFDVLAVGAFIMQSLLILLAPALFAASIYAILGRLIVAVRASHLAIIRPALTTMIFVTGDVLSFLLQAAGGGLQGAGTLEFYEMGEKIILAGLFVQIAFFGFFVVTTVIFHSRLFKQPPLSSIPYHRHLLALYGVSFLILVRSIFRVVEYLQGNGGYLISHEIFLYLLDMALMAAVMLLFLVWYVDDLGPTARKDSELGMTEGDTPMERLGSDE